MIRCAALNAKEVAMIAWESDIGKALTKGKTEQKCILLEFFNPECIGCKQMDEVTFADTSVINFMESRLIALRVPIDTHSMVQDFRVFWTPTLITLDYYGREHQRTLGYLPPDEMVASLLLGIGKAALGQGQFNEAGIQFNTLLNGLPGSAAAPEAVYLRGVARYQSSHAVSALQDAYRQLLAEYPGSEWTGRAKPYTLL
jgi:hypothetical protein